MASYKDRSQEVVRSRSTVVEMSSKSVQKDDVSYLVSFGVLWWYDERETAQGRTTKFESNVMTNGG